MTVISNEFRCVSLSSAEGQREAFGTDDVLGYRLVNGTLKPTGFSTDRLGADPLEIILLEEAEHEIGLVG